MIETLSIEELAARIPDGASIAVAPDYSGCSMAAIKALIRRRARNLHIIGVPACGLQLDWLIGAGCVKRVEAAAVTLGESGLAPRFSAVIKAGAIEMRDATCPAIHAGLQASEKGIPFMPLRGILGSDLLTHRDDWMVIDNPLSATPDRIVLIPALKPDVALFHAAAADRNGNVWIGVRREMMLMAHAAKRTYVTVERIEDTDFLVDDNRASGSIPSLYITAIAVAPGGAKPIGLASEYPADAAVLADYANAARTEEGFAEWLAVNVLDREREPV